MVQIDQHVLSTRDVQGISFEVGHVSAKSVIFEVKPS
jgi:hypothetical protein